jgi:hypothetical protein
MSRSTTTNGGTFSERLEQHGKDGVREEETEICRANGVHLDDPRKIRQCSSTSA